MRKVIQYAFTGRRELYIYGFGSFFRGECYNDIDIMIVFGEQCNSPLLMYYEVKNKLDTLGRQLEERFHLLAFTYEEFGSRPLQNMSSLVALYSGSGVSGTEFRGQSFGDSLRD
jgi:predicted nucleotidyltransferase